MGGWGVGRPAHNTHGVAHGSHTLPGDFWTSPQTRFLIPIFSDIGTVFWAAPLEMQAFACVVRFKKAFILEFDVRRGGGVF